MAGAILYDLFALGRKWIIFLLLGFSPYLADFVARAAFGTLYRKRNATSAAFMAGIYIYM